MWRLPFLASAVISYALLSHWLMLRAADSPWAVAVLLGPLVLTLGGVALARRQWGIVALTLLVLVGLAVLVQRGGVSDLNRLYVLQHAGMHLALGAAFASSLRVGARPMITAIASRVHLDGLTPAMQVYTRQVTVAWSLYFAGMASVSLALYLGAPWAWWSGFANIGTPLALLAMMVGEHALRYRLHPEFERVSISTAVRAYRQSTGAITPLP